jgi:hypothetical protein
MSIGRSSRGGATRGARRRAVRQDGRVEAPTRASILSLGVPGPLALLIWAGATAVFLGYAWVAVEHKITWYLSVDQLGYLVFAHDLLDGKIFHQWPPADAFATLLPERTDVLSQSYLWDQGNIYSRYAPGFPILLAAWIALFGDPAVHLLNPLIFLALLGVLIGLEWRTHRSLWRGTAVAVLAVICPTGVSLWALTTTRDLAAHLGGFVGLLLLAGQEPLRMRALVGAGVAIGFAGSVRPDAVLYLIPATVLALGRWWPRRGEQRLRWLAGVGALAVLLGLAPSLTYYWVATGNPFMPTQAMEVTEFLGGPTEMPVQPAPAEDRVGYAPQAWRGTTAAPVSGGGLKLEYLSTTLPGNWEKVVKAYGHVLLGLAVAGLVVGVVLQPAFTLALGAYLVVALLFYSCWGRPYGRYLVGVWLIVPILIVGGAAGSLDLVHRLARQRTGIAARWIAIGAAVLLFAATLALAPRTDGTALPALTYLLGLGVAVALVAAAIWPGRALAPLVAPALALALVWLGSVRLAGTLATRAPFQRPQAERATATVQRTLGPRAVVITTEDIGRAAENLEYYGGVNALYLTDLERWQIPIWRAAFFLMVSEREPYLLLPRALPDRENILMGLRPHVLLDRIAEIPPERNADYFVVSPFHAGVPLELWHLR